MPSIFKAEKDMDLTEVQGRDGFLTNDYGSYKPVIKTVECIVRDLTNIDYVCAWLTGSATCVFSNEPTKIYKAVIKNQIEFSKILRNFHKFIIQFECMPHKYAAANGLITLTTSPAIVNNAATANSKPLIKIYGNGAINITINGYTIYLTNIVDYVTLDTDIMDAYKDDENMNNYMVGDCQELVVGTNNISWTGSVSKIEITPNWKYL